MFALQIKQNYEKNYFNNTIISPDDSANFLKFDLC